jgi:hypothetical protein
MNLVLLVTSMFLRIATPPNSSDAPIDKGKTTTISTVGAGWEGAITGAVMGMMRGG